MRASGRDIDVSPAVLVCVDDDVAKARDMARPWLAIYLGGMGAKGKNFYVETAERMGHGESAAKVQELFMAGDRAGAAAAISDEIIDGSLDLLPARRARRPAGGVRARGRRHAARHAVRRPPADSRGARRRRPRRRGVSAQSERPTGLEGSGLKGPFPVGEYAAALRGQAARARPGAGVRRGRRTRA